MKKIVLLITLFVSFHANAALVTWELIGIVTSKAQFQSPAYVDIGKTVVIDFSFDDQQVITPSVGPNAIVSVAINGQVSTPPTLSNGYIDNSMIRPQFTGRADGLDTITFIDFNQTSVHTNISVQGALMVMQSDLNAYKSGAKVYGNQFTLNFDGIFGVALSAQSLNPVPLPASSYFFASTLGGLFFKARRKNLK